MCSMVGFSSTAATGASMMAFGSAVVAADGDDERLPPDSAPRQRPKGGWKLHYESLPGQPPHHGIDRNILLPASSSKLASVLPPGSAHPLAIPSRTGRTGVRSRRRRNRQFGSRRSLLHLLLPDLANPLQFPFDGRQGAAEAVPKTEEEHNLIRWDEES